MAVTAEQRPLLFALRALFLGDFLVAVPALRALRRGFPEHEVRLATTAGVAPLAPLTDAVDRVAPARGPDDFCAPARSIDVAVNLHGRGPQSTTALRALRPNRLLSFDVADDVVSSPRWDDDWPGHERERWCGMLAAYGISADPADYRLRAPEVRPPVRDATVIHPGAASAARRWPARRYAEVARALRRAGHDVVITGARSELRLATAVAELAGLSPSAVFAGKTDVLALAALIAHAQLVVCGDTGPAHLASAYATSSVVLFGPTPPRRWGPPTDPRHITLWRDSVGGDPRGDEPDPALLAIDVADVLDEVERVLAERDDVLAG